MADLLTQSTDELVAVSFRGRRFREIAEKAQKTRRALLPSAGRRPDLRRLGEDEVRLRMQSAPDTEGVVGLRTGVRLPGGGAQRRYRAEVGEAACLQRSNHGSRRIPVRCLHDEGT